MSHFFAADDVFDITIKEQIEKFKRIYYKILDA